MFHVKPSPEINATVRAVLEQLVEKHRQQLRELVAQSEGLNAAIQRVKTKLEALNEALGQPPRLMRRVRPRNSADREL